MFCPILNANRSPKMEYLLISVLFAIPVTNNHVLIDIDGNHAMLPVYFVIVDPMYCVVVNNDGNHPVCSALHEWKTGFACVRTPLP